MAHVCTSVFSRFSTSGWLVFDYILCFWNCLSVFFIPFKILPQLISWFVGSFLQTIIRYLILLLFNYQKQEYKEHQLVLYSAFLSSLVIEYYCFVIILFIIVFIILTWTFEIWILSIYEWNSSSIVYLR